MGFCPGLAAKAVSYPSLPVYTKSTHYAHRCAAKCTITDDILCTSASKFISSTICYPIESVRMLLLSNSLQKTDKTILTKLYAGYEYFLPYNIFHSLTTYIILFHSMNILGNLEYSQSLLLASSITSLITSLYKVPCIYIIRRKLMTDSVCTKHLMDLRYFGKAVCAFMLEDIPDIYIKFYLNHILKQLFIIPSIYQSMIVGLLACLLLTPLEFIKTKMICYDMKVSQNILTIYIRALNSILNTALFFAILDILKKAITVPI
jgi:hypothetical protein